MHFHATISYFAVPQNGSKFGCLVRRKRLGSSVELTARPEHDRDEADPEDEEMEEEEEEEQEEEQEQEQ